MFFACTPDRFNVMNTKLLESGRPRSLIVHDALVGYYLLGPDGTVTQYLDYLGHCAHQRSISTNLKC